MTNPNSLRRNVLKGLAASGAGVAAASAAAATWVPITPANATSGATWQKLTSDTNGAGKWNLVGRQQIANCGGYLPNGNCAGNAKYVPPNGSWQTWGLGFSSANPYGYTGALTNCSAVTVSPIGFADGNWNYCNCGSFYYVNCNCNCNCAYCADCGFCCFPKGTRVRTAAGDELPIEEVEIGVELAALHGVSAVQDLVICVVRPGDKVYRVNGKVECTWEQLFLGVDGVWRAVDVAGYRAYRAKHQEGYPEFGLADDQFVQMVAGDVIHTEMGPTEVALLEYRVVTTDEQLHSFVMEGSRTFYVNDYLVESRISADSCFDLSDC